MRYIKKTLVAILAMALIMACSIIPVMAGEVLTVKAVDKGGAAEVTGTAAADVLSVVVILADSTSGDVVTMKSVEVKADGTYAADLKVDKGDYTVKVADYEGGNFKTTTVTVTSAEDPILGENSTTGILVLMMALAAGGIVITRTVRREN